MVPTPVPTELPTPQPTSLPTPEPSPIPTPSPTSYDCRFNHTGMACGDTRKGRLHIPGKGLQMSQKIKSFDVYFFDVPEGDFGHNTTITAAYTSYTACPAPHAARIKSKI